MQKRTYNRRMFDPVKARKQPDTEQDVRHDAHRFLKAHVFMEKLRRYANDITMQEYRDLRTMALDGDLPGAEKKLDVILRTKRW